MSTFGENQVRKLFIANAVNSAARATVADLAEGEVQSFKADGNGAPTAAGDKFFVATRQGGLIIKSEIIDPAKLLIYNKHDFNVYLPKFTLTLTGTPTSATGKVVDFVIAIENYGANNSSSEPYYMHVSHTIVAGDTLATITDGLVSNGNITAEKEGIPFTFSSSTPGEIVATSARTPFKLGKFAGEPVNASAVVKLEGTDLSGIIVTSSTSTVNGIEIANLEWFSLGNTGDIYRGLGYPNNIDTNYVANTSADYTMVEISFYTERIKAPGDKQAAQVSIAIDKSLDATNVATQITDPIEAALA